MTATASRDVLAPFERFLLTAPENAIDNFFSSWSPDLIMRLRQLNSNLFLGVETYMSRAWSIRRSMDRWFFHVGAFLRTLEACDAIVAGCEAQQHLARHDLRGTDMDIYLPYHGLLKMGRWLKQQGFVYQATEGKHAFFDAAVVILGSAANGGAIGHGKSPNDVNSFTMFSFIRPQSDTLHTLGMDGSRIQLYAVRGDPVQFVIENLHTSMF